MTNPPQTNRITDEEASEPELERYPDGTIPAPARYIHYSGQVIIRTCFATIQRWKKEQSPDLLTADYCTARDRSPKNDSLDINEIQVYYVEDNETVTYRVTGDQQVATDGGTPITEIERREEEVTYRCTACDEFDLTKSYSGGRGTRGEQEYEDTGVDECPACGGEVERISRE